MASHEHYAAVPGSAHQIATSARVSPVDPNEPIEVSVYVRPSQAPQQRAAGGTPQRLSRDEYASRHGADPDELAKVESFAREHGLSVVDSDPARRVVVLRGTARAMNDAFDVELNRYQEENQTYRSHAGPVRVPAELAPLVQGVFGLHDRPQTRPLLRIFQPPTGAVRANQTPTISYTPPQVAQLYDFPTAGDGSGQSVAIIELGGGYQESDLSAYFQRLGIAEPEVVSVSVDGAQNNPGADSGADTEVALDIEIVGAVAPGARVVVYFAPNTDRGFLDAVTTAVHDTTYNPSVMSISWGSAESDWTQMAMTSLDQAFQAAVTVGVTVCCASGDSGSSDRVSDGLAHVDFPASSPSVLGCGGTRLDSSAGKITSEVTWNEGGGATGGGVSDVFDLPTWQQSAGVPTSANPGGRVGRGVPDVAAVADPATGYDVQVGGQLVHGIGGTSAAAPLWAGLLALVNQQLSQSVGLLDAPLYAAESQSQSQSSSNPTRDITSGNNGAYQARSGWDACTGLGSPRGSALLAMLKSSSG